MKLKRYKVSASKWGNHRVATVFYFSSHSKDEVLEMWAGSYGRNWRMDSIELERTNYGSRKHFFG